jgi:hypothetical protein
MTVSYAGSHRNPNPGGPLQGSVLSALGPSFRYVPFAVFKHQLAASYTMDTEAPLRLSAETLQTLLRGPCSPTACRSTSNFWSFSRL